MIKRLGKIVQKKRVTIFSLSNDWNTLTPWEHPKGTLAPYFSKFTKISDSGKVLLTYIYLGPFSIVTGKWIAD